MSETIREIEMTMDAAKKKVEKLELLERLKENFDFKAFILEEFMGKDRIQDLITKKVSPAFQDAANKLYIDSQLQAIGAFRMFMLYIEQEGRMAKQALIEAEEERIRALNEVAD